ncbi:MAG: hypothetical protein H6Q55_1128, partial [Deltaproteobacteria bacterium]|jgi:uncharacterized membrane protein YhaH (DUF805 family)|nr:hypothetical protein [Deltaproteobacteria bacterium]
MQRALFWFVFGAMITFAVMLMVFGVLFMKDVYVSMGSGSAEVTFTSLLFGIILLLVGGGLLCSTIAETIRKLLAK